MVKHRQRMTTGHLKLHDIAIGDVRLISSSSRHPRPFWTRYEGRKVADGTLIVPVLIAEAPPPYRQLRRRRWWQRRTVR